MTHIRCLAGLLALAGTLACQAEGGPASPGPPGVVVSVPPQAWFVERLAGPRVRVAVLLPPGASPAHFEPGVRELEALARASLCVRVGHPRFPIEGAWLDALLAERPELAVVSTTPDAMRGDDDPHTWVSPAGARVMARRIAAALMRLLPDDRAALEANQASLLAEIDAVDAELRGRLSGRRGGSFVVFHPAWSHLAREYGLVQIAIESHGASPDPATLARRVREARAAGVSVIFAQPQFDAASAELVAREIGARVERLDPLAYDWAANLRAVGIALAGAMGP